MPDGLSIQLYSLRSLNDLDRSLDIVAAAGFRWVEGIGSHLDDADATKSKIEARGLRFSSCHVSLAALRERPEQVIAACKTLGLRDLFMPSVPPPERNSDAAYWRALGKELGTLGRRFAESDIRLGYHNHNWELAPKDGETTALELLFAESEDTPLTWEADIAWLVRGGADPGDWLRRYSNRLVAAHVKDIAPEGTNLDEDGWADVGAGILDWRSLWRECKDCGAEWMVLEHDKPADPERCARISFNYLQRIEE